MLLLAELLVQLLGLMTALPVWIEVLLWATERWDLDWEVVCGCFLLPSGLRGDKGESEQSQP